MRQTAYDGSTAKDYADKKFGKLNSMLWKLSATMKPDAIREIKIRARTRRLSGKWKSIVNLKLTISNLVDQENGSNLSFEAGSQSKKVVSRARRRSIADMKSLGDYRV